MLERVLKTCNLLEALSVNPRSLKQIRCSIAIQSVQIAVSHYKISQSYARFGNNELAFPHEFQNAYLCV